MDPALFVARIKTYASRFFDIDVVKQEVSPYRDWAVVLALFFVFITVGAACAFLVFASVSSEKVPVAPASEVVKTYSAEELAGALRVFEDKEDELEALMGARSSIADPSL